MNLWIEDNQSLKLNVDDKSKNKYEYNGDKW